MTELNNSYHFVFLFEAKNCNPNGDPDADNAPRTDIETDNGLVTGVCIKSKIRNYVMTMKNDKPPHAIYIRKGAVLNEQHALAYKELNIKPSKDLPKDKAEANKLTNWMCQNFWDIRTFGAVMTTSVNTGQVMGPVSISISESVDPVVPTELAITRKARTKDDNKGETEMGRFHKIPYGLYMGVGAVDATLAEKTGFSEDDLQLLWEAMGMMFEYDRSATRGDMAMRNLIAFKHDSKYYNVPRHKLLDLVKVSRTTDEFARSYSDYKVEVDTKSLPNGVSFQEHID